MIIPYSLNFLLTHICIIKDRTTKLPLLQAKLQHGLYYISFSSPLLTSSPQAYLSERVSADLWHARLGNPSTTTTLQVFNSYNLPYTSTKLSSCHDCSVAKCHRLPLMLSTSSSSAPLELVHSYLWGGRPVAINKWFSLLCGVY